MEHNVACADWGGTNCRGVIVTVDGDELHLQEKTFRAFPCEHEPDARQILRRSIGASIDAFNGKVHGVAVAFAGPVEGHHTVLHSPNIQALHGHTPFPLNCLLEREFGLPSAVLNDLEAGMGGELSQGSLRGKKWAALENIGSGYGGALLLNGIPVATEPGHIWVPGSGSCGCGQKDCAEARLSGIGVERRLREMHNAGTIHIPEQDWKDPCKFLDREALQDTPWAVRFYDQIAAEIGQTWGSKLNLIPPITNIAYQGSFIRCAMRIGTVRQKIMDTMVARSMFPQHAQVEVHEVTAPRMTNGESAGPLYGDAIVWNQIQKQAA